MMDLVLVSGDRVMFNPVFAHRMVTVLAPVTLVGTGRASINGKPICVKGDEKNVTAPATYAIPGYSPGTGIVKIKQLASNQYAPRTEAGKQVLLKGMLFVAEFRPEVPAILIAPPNTADPKTPTPGMGTFLPTQTFAWIG